MACLYCSHAQGKKQSKLCTKEQRLQIVAAQSQQVKEMVTIDLCNEAPPSDKRVPEGCKNLLCAAEKERLREEIKALKQTLADHAGNYDCYMLTPLPKKKRKLTCLYN